MNKWTIILSSLLIIISSCGSNDDPGPDGATAITPTFTATMDPNIPGKVIVTNTTENVEGYQFFWDLWLADGDGGNLTTSSTYSRTTSGDENTYFYIQENRWVYIAFTIYNDDEEYSTDTYMEVDNIPGSVRLDSIQITYVNPVDPDGNPWDGGTDGPDLTVMTIPTRYCGESSKTNWDVDIENDLPVTLLAIDGQATREDFSPQTQEFYMYFGDVEGYPNIISCQSLSGMGTVRLNPYHLTHKYNKGDDDNYPAIHEIETSSLKANLYFTWY